MDRSLPGRRLVVPSAGDDQCGGRAVVGRPDRPAVRPGRQAGGCAAAAVAAAGLSIPGAALQCQLGVVRALAAGGLLLPALVRNPRDRVVCRGRRVRRVLHPRQILFRVSDRGICRGRRLPSAAVELFQVAGAMGLHRRRRRAAGSPCPLARHLRDQSVRLCAGSPWPPDDSGGGRGQRNVRARGCGDTCAAAPGLGPVRQIEVRPLSGGSARDGSGLVAAGVDRHRNPRRSAGGHDRSQKRDNSDMGGAGIVSGHRRGRGRVDVCARAHRDRPACRAPARGDLPDACLRTDPRRLSQQPSVQGRPELLSAGGAGVDAALARGLDRAACDHRRPRALPCPELLRCRPPRLRRAR